jgi:hypothetical protein
MWAWQNAKTISFLTIGIIMLLVFIIIEAYFARIPIIPLPTLQTEIPGSTYPYRFLSRLCLAVNSVLYSTVLPNRPWFLAIEECHVNCPVFTGTGYSWCCFGAFDGQVC